ncbi:hypothetical protein D918_01851 [Trichuris suis]|nr:hypothetical protein D918_01851 [Trichuris suis]
MQVHTANIEQRRMFGKRNNKRPGRLAKWSLLMPSKHSNFMTPVSCTSSTGEEVIAAYKAFAARWTGETLFARMRSQMSLQLVTSGESFSAEQPVANERSLSGVPSKGLIFPLHDNLGSRNSICLPLNICKIKTHLLMAVM